MIRWIVLSVLCTIVGLGCAVAAPRADCDLPGTRAETRALPHIRLVHEDLPGAADRPLAIFDAGPAPREFILNLREPFAAAAAAAAAMDLSMPMPPPPPPPPVGFPVALNGPLDHDPVDRIVLFFAQQAVARTAALTMDDGSVPIGVVSPGPGEQWAPGTTHNVSWNVDPRLAQENAEVHVCSTQDCSAVPGAVDLVIWNGVVPGGSVRWTVPLWIAEGSYFVVVRIGTVEGASLAFSIAGPAPIPRVYVLSPTAMDEWSLGDTELITWAIDSGGSPPLDDEPRHLTREHISGMRRMWRSAWAAHRRRFHSGDFDEPEDLRISVDVHSCAMTPGSSDPCSDDAVRIPGVVLAADLQPWAQRLRWRVGYARDGTSLGLEEGAYRVTVRVPCPGSSSSDSTCTVIGASSRFTIAMQSPSPDPRSPAPHPRFNPLRILLVVGVVAFVVVLIVIIVRAVRVQRAARERLARAEAAAAATPAGVGMPRLVQIARPAAIPMQVLRPAPQAFYGPTAVPPAYMPAALVGTPPLASVASMGPGLACGPPALAAPASWSIPRPLYPSVDVVAPVAPNVAASQPLPLSAPALFAPIPGGYAAPAPAYVGPTVSMEGCGTSAPAAAAAMQPLLVQSALSSQPYASGAGSQASPWV